MSGFSRCGSALAAAAPDPRKRVNFVPGLVLGAEDLTQESAFLASRGEWLARDLIGFGTVAGLRVTRDILGGNGVGILVSAGVALSPGGRPIVVPMPLAVALDDWLDVHRSEVLYNVVPGFDSPPSEMLPLFLVLAYRQCATDDEPAPGEPCRTDEPPRLFTRLADDFALELRLTPPDQSYEDMVRELGAWLRAIEIVDAPAGTVTLDELLDALRAAGALTSPPEPIASPPEALRVFRGDAVEFFRAAWRVWVTELRWPSRAAAATSDAVLLAALEVPIVSAPDGRLHVDGDATLAIREERRPFLLSLRVIQELLLGATPGGGIPFVTPAAVSGSASAAEPAAAPAPAAGPVVAPLPVRVVAAGVIKGNNKPQSYRQPVLNGLRVAAAKAGELLLGFKDYKVPKVKDDYQYLVTVLPSPIPADENAAAPTPATPVVVNLLGFEDEGIRLLVATLDGTPVPVKVMALLDLSIEISEYRP
jgi:hypothetical protein